MKKRTPASFQDRFATVRPLYRAMHQAGVQLFPSGPTVRYRARPGALTPQLRQGAQEHADKLRAYVRHRAECELVWSLWDVETAYYALCLHAHTWPPTISWPGERINDTQRYRDRLWSDLLRGPSDTLLSRVIQARVHHLYHLLFPSPANNTPKGAN